MTRKLAQTIESATKQTLTKETRKRKSGHSQSKTVNCQLKKTQIVVFILSRLDA